ncbi:MAG: M23 family metallopeptidase, partial [Limnohabitans sp.]
MSLLICGSVLNLIGLRVAVEYNPDLARSLGGVTTEAEQLRMESVYRQNLQQLQASLDQTVQDVKKLEALNNRFMNLATPAGLKEKSSLGQNSKGGPFVLPSVTQNLMGQILKQPLQTQLQQTAAHVQSVNQLLSVQKQNWEQHLNWLEALPIGLPIQQEFRLNSGFGLRNDPFTDHLAMHEGIDFSAELGTPVVAPANGQVVRSEWDSTYGNVIEIQHAENFVTRYA